MSNAADKWEADYMRAKDDLLGHIAAFVDSEFGRRCSTFDKDCSTCKLWKLHDEMAEILK